MTTRKVHHHNLTNTLSKRVAIRHSELLKIILVTKHNKDHQNVSNIFPSKHTTTSIELISGVPHAMLTLTHYGAAVVFSSFCQTALKLQCMKGTCPPPCQFVMTCIELERGPIDVAAPAHHACCNFVMSLQWLIRPGSGSSSSYRRHHSDSNTETDILRPLRTCLLGAQCK